MKHHKRKKKSKRGSLSLDDGTIDRNDIDDIMCLYGTDKRTRKR